MLIELDAAVEKFAGSEFFSRAENPNQRNEIAPGSTREVPVTHGGLTDTAPAEGKTSSNIRLRAWRQCPAAQRDPDGGRAV